MRIIKIENVLINVEAISCVDMGAKIVYVGDGNVKLTMSEANLNRLLKVLEEFEIEPRERKEAKSA